MTDVSPSPAGAEGSGDAGRIATVGVVGAGVMGRGLAQNLAQTGHDVVLIDVEPEILEAAESEIRNTLRFSGMFGKKKGPPADEVIARIAFTTDYERLGAADFVVENAIEKWEVKRQIYPVIDREAPPHAVFAANTSCIPITKIGGVTGRPEKILGMHFMNPVPLKDTVEVIRGYHTTDETIATALQLLSQMGKDGIVVNDSPGFVSNRVLMLTVNEAAYLVHDGVSNAEDIDRLFVQCFGHKMGPLATADLIGLDTILYSVEVLYEEFNDSKYRPCPLLKKMVDAGLLGRKSGKGFHTYDPSA